MKKLTHYITTALCVMGMTVPPCALAISQEDANEILNEPVEQASDKSFDDNDYHLVFLTGGFDMFTSDSIANKQIDYLMLFVSTPDGKVVKNAKVINTIISSNGKQMMNVARPYKGGYAIPISHLPTGKYRLETEVATDGQLMTDEFNFYKA